MINAWINETFDYCTVFHTDSSYNLAIFSRTKFRIWFDDRESEELTYSSKYEDNLNEFWEKFKERILYHHNFEVSDEFKPNWVK